MISTHIFIDKKKKNSYQFTNEIKRKMPSADIFKTTLNAGRSKIGSVISFSY